MSRCWSRQVSLRAKRALVALVAPPLDVDPAALPAEAAAAGAYEPRFLWDGMVTRAQQTELLVDLLYQGLGLAGRDGTRRHLAILLEQLVYDACDLQDALVRDVVHAEEAESAASRRLPVVAWWKAQGWLAKGLQARGVLPGGGDNDGAAAERAAGLVLPRREGTAARLSVVMDMLDCEREDVRYEAAAFLQVCSLARLRLFGLVWIFCFGLQGVRTRMAVEGCITRYD